MGVQPWEREILAREDMQLTTDPLEAATDDHIYFSKEASKKGAERDKIESQRLKNHKVYFISYKSLFFLQHILYAFRSLGVV